MKEQTTLRSIDRYTEKGCEHIVNLRPRGPKWFPVGAKQMVAHTGEALLYHHHVQPSNKVIAAKKTSNGYQVTLRLIGMGGIQDTVIDEIQSDQISLSSLGNVLLVNTEKDIRQYLWKDNQYNRLEKIDNPSITREKDVKKYIPQPVNELEKLVGDYLVYRTEQQQENYYGGAVLITTAWQMVDDSVILHNSIIYDDLQFENSNNSDDYAHWNQQEPVTIDPYVRLGVKSGFSDAYEPINFNLSMIKYRLDFNNTMLNNYKDIIKSINIYAHYLSDVFNWSVDTEEYTGVYIQLDDGYVRNLFPSRSLSVNDFFTSPVFRKIHSIPIADIIDNPTQEYTLDLTNFDVQEPLSIDNSTHHYLMSINQPYTFNNAVHFPGTVTKFGIGNNNIAKIIGPTINFNSQPFTPTDNSVELLQIVEIETDSGIFYADKAINAQILDGNGFFGILVEPFISYPDRRARKLTICTTSLKIVLQVSLVAHPSLNVAYHVLKEETQRRGSLAKYRLVYYNPDGVSYTFTPGKLYREPHRLQVSELDNPLFFPAKYSYQVNKSESIIDCISVAEEVGSGQRGQFPLFIFSDSQIYLLQQGTDILYQQLVPMHRVGVKSKATATGRYVLFAAHDGLYLMDGRGQINNISEQIYNDPVILETDIDIEKSIPRHNFPDFIEGSLFLFDNIHNEILVSNPELQFTYVYNPAEKSWYQRNDYFTQSLVIQSNHHLISGGKMYSLTESKDEILPFYFQTNPIRFSSYDYKKIRQAILRGVVKTDTEILFDIFIENYDKYLQVNRVVKLTEDKSLDIKSSHISASSKSFIFVSSGKLTNDGYILFFESIADPSFNTKLR